MGANPTESEVVLRDEAKFEQVRMRRFGRTIGALFVLGSLSAVPGAIRVNADPLIYPLIGCGVIVGLGCLFLVPWERYSRRAFYVTGILGIVEPALAVAFGGLELSFYYAFVVVTGAYVFTTRSELATLLAGVSAALLLPIVYSDQPSRAIDYAAFAIPSLVMAAVMVRYLREQLERHHEATRAFAVEALSIAERLTGNGDDRLAASGDRPRERRHRRAA